MTLKGKLLTFGVALTIVPLALVAGIVYHQNNKMREAAEKESLKLAYNDLDHTAQGVYNMLLAQQELLEEKLKANLNVATHVLAGLGGVRLGEEAVSWEAKNQFNGELTRVELPKMLLNGRWLGQNKSLAQETPLVDQIKSLVGGAVTLFQRMDSSGNMLRVATNVEAADGSRAIGTYIPVTNPDGTPNPVLKSVLSGQRFVGRAFVVNSWYLTAYDPYQAKCRQRGSRRRPYA